MSCTSASVIVIKNIQPVCLFYYRSAFLGLCRELPGATSGYVEGFRKSFIIYLFFRFSGPGKSGGEAGGNPKDETVHVLFFPVFGPGRPQITPGTSPNLLWNFPKQTPNRRRTDPESPLTFGFATPTPPLTIGLATPLLPLAFGFLTLDDHILSYRTLHDLT